MSNLYGRLPVDIQNKIDTYLLNTTFDTNYRKKIHSILFSELKMNFCFNCRRFFHYKNKKIINKIFVNSWDNILNNIMNESCILEKDTSRDKENYICLLDDNIIINHWHMKDKCKSFAKRDLKKDKKKYIKLHRIYNKYIYYDIKNRIDQI